MPIIIKRRSMCVSEYSYNSHHDDIVERREMIFYWQNAWRVMMRSGVGGSTSYVKPLFTAVIEFPC